MRPDERQIDDLGFFVGPWKSYFKVEILILIFSKITYFLNWNIVHFLIENLNSTKSTKITCNASLIVI